MITPEQLKNLESHTDKDVQQLLEAYTQITKSKVYKAWKAIQKQLDKWQEELEANPISLRATAAKVKKNKKGEETEGDDEVDPTFRNHLVVIDKMPNFVIKQRQLEKMMTGDEKAEMEKDESEQVWT